MPLATRNPAASPVRPAYQQTATYQDQARDTSYPPDGEHPSLPGVKLADLAPQDPTAYAGLEAYLGQAGGAVARAARAAWPG